jgi:hypothetical protein
MSPFFFKNYTVFLLKRLSYSFARFIFYFTPLQFGEERLNFVYSIGIVTYVDRYRRFFKSLIKNLVTIFPDTEFVIAINGYHDEKIQKKYLSEITQYLQNFKNVRIVPFVEPQSLSKLWNLLILNSTSSKIIILNDDLSILKTFRKHLERSVVLQTDISIINSSWSHFVISKKIIDSIGWFDERMPAVGNEDQDYECRLVFGEIVLNDCKVKGIRNIVFKTKNFSYGKDVEINEKKYIKKNQEFFDSKWELSIIDRPGFKYVRILRQYARLKPGMETPDFSSSSSLGQVLKKTK